MNRNALIFGGLCAVVLAGASATTAGERTLTLRDYTGRGFAPDVVNYTVTVSRGGAKAFRLFGPDGAPAPVQVSAPAKDGKSTLSFVAELHAGDWRRANAAGGAKALLAARGNVGHLAFQHARFRSRPAAHAGPADLGVDPGAAVVDGSTWTKKNERKFTTRNDKTSDKKCHVTMDTVEV